MKEPENFYNDGFGWLCRACELRFEAPEETGKHSRLLREGEAESKTPRLASLALAKWADDARTTLVCPRCKATERVVKS
jgi:hypothetical protein